MSKQLGLRKDRLKPLILQTRNQSTQTSVLQGKRENAGSSSGGIPASRGSEQDKENIEAGVPRAKKIRCRKSTLLKETTNESYDIPIHQDLFHAVLPNEIKHFILEKLDFRDILTCRVLSSRWKDSVDSFRKFNVVIDERKFNGICTVPMKTCEIHALRLSQNRRLFQNPTPDKVEIGKRISQWNVGEMSTKWNDLTALKICWKPLMSIFLFRHCLRPEQTLVSSGFFPDLKSLSLDLATSVEGEMMKIQDQNLSYILQWHYPSLSHLLINFIDTEVRQEMLSKLTSFISRQAETLQKVDIHFSNMCRKIPLTIPQRSLLFHTDEYSWHNRVQLAKANAIKLSEYSLENPYKNSEIEKKDNSEQWQKILRKERNLQLLILTKLHLNIRRFEYFHHNIKMYAPQMTVIELINLSVYDIDKNERMTPLDISLFKDCINLRKIGLWRAPVLLNESIPEPSSEIINLSSLPGLVTSITIDGLPAESSDILLTLKCLRNLTQFYYSRAAMPRRNHLPQSGVTMSVIEALLVHPKLTKINVTTASSVPHTFCFDNYNELRSSAITNNWKVNEIRQLWHTCIKVSLDRTFQKRVP